MECNTCNPIMVKIEWIPTQGGYVYDSLLYNSLVHDSMDINNFGICILLFKSEKDYILWRIKYGNYENDVFKIIENK